ncbi:MAG: formylglycine-generating enzyme family protein, partial [Oscillochloris sp.]|nr:formylglycine-generating enzyme family protein [Oscillochloris sp.]
MTDLAALLPQFVAISAGSFLMGTPKGDLSRLAQRYGGTRESYREESPQHHVMLPAFAITATLVTNALYAAFTAASNSPPPQGPADHPVVDVSWHEAYAFCAWISRIADYPLQIVDFATGQSVVGKRIADCRLPTT